MWFPPLPSPLTLLCQILSPTPRACSQTAETPANHTRQRTPAKVEGRGTHVPPALQVEWEPQNWPGLLPTSTLCPFPPKHRVYMQVEEFLSSGAGKTTAAFDCLENNLQFTKHSFPLSHGNARCHPVRQAGRGPSAPTYRVRKKRLWRMKSLPWGHQAGVR